MQSSVKSAVLIIAVALGLLVISVFGAPSTEEFFHTRGHFSYYTDGPYATIPPTSTWEHILNATEIDNQSARLVQTSVTFNSIRENNDTEYLLDFLAKTSSGQEREYRVWGTLNRSSRSNRIFWKADDPDSRVNTDSSFNRQNMSHPAAVLADVGQMNFTRIGYRKENLRSLEFTTLRARKFSDAQNSALYFFANGTFIPLFAIDKDPAGPGSVLELIELTSIDPPGGMTGSGVAVIISPSMITPADRIVYRNLSEPRVPKPGPRVYVVTRPRTTLNQ